MKGLVKLLLLKTTIALAVAPAFGADLNIARPSQYLLAQAPADTAPAAAPAPAPATLGSATLPSAPTATATPPVSLDWYKIGQPFGKNQAWQFGLDTSAMPAGGCVQRELHNGQYLAGPCRDILLLARNAVPTFQLGAAALANTERGNMTYGPYLGVNVGSVGKAALASAAQKAPVIENLLDYQMPPFVAYLDKVLSVDFKVGYRPHHDASVKGNLTYGPMVKLNLPLDDVIALLKLGL